RLYTHRSPRTQAMTKRVLNRETLAATERFGEVAAECGLALPTFAIAWTLTRDFLGATILGATHPDQLDVLLTAAEAKLPTDALAAVDKISREIRYPMGRAGFAAMG